MLGGFLHICTYTCTIYCGLWPPNNTGCIFLTWYQGYMFFFSHAQLMHSPIQSHSTGAVSLFPAVVATPTCPSCNFGRPPAVSPAAQLPVAGCVLRRLLSALAGRASRPCSVWISRPDQPPRGRRCAAALGLPPGSRGRCCRCITWPLLLLRFLCWPGSDRDRANLDLGRSVPAASAQNWSVLLRSRRLLLGFHQSCPGAR
jgi:hypothetical protein